MSCETCKRLRARIREISARVGRQLEDVKKRNRILARATRAGQAERAAAAKRFVASRGPELAEFNAKTARILERARARRRPEDTQ